MDLGQGFKGGKEKQSGPPGMASKKDKHPGVCGYARWRNDLPIPL